MARPTLFTLFLAATAVAAFVRADDPESAAPKPAPPVPEAQVQTFTLPRDPRLNLFYSISTEDEVQLTWRNRRNAPLSFGAFGGGPVVALGTDWNVAAGGSKDFRGRVGSAFTFQTAEQARGPVTKGYNICTDGVFMIIPDNKSHLPLAKGFDAVQTIDIPAKSYDDQFKFTFSGGKGTISCMNDRDTGYGTAWKKESSKDGESIVEYYVQIADTNATPIGGESRFKVLRNLANRHTIRLHTDNTSEQAMPGDTEWRPYDTGRWNIPR